MNYTIKRIVTACLVATIAQAMLFTHPAQALEYANAPVTVYKTKGDYNNLVPITLSKGGTYVVSHPHPHGISPRSIPTVLKQGYLLDNRGVSVSSVFLDIMYEDFAKREDSLTNQEKADHIVHDKPFLEMYDCSAIGSDASRINEVIEKGQLSKACKQYDLSFLDMQDRYTLDCPRFDKNIGYKSTIQDVSRLQEVLNSIKTDADTKLEITGRYDIKTVRAVRVFQKESGITATGFFGPLTRRALEKKLCTKESKWYQSSWENKFVNQKQNIIKDLPSNDTEDQQDDGPKIRSLKGEVYPLDLMATCAIGPGVFSACNGRAVLLWDVVADTCTIHGDNVRMETFQYNKGVNVSPREKAVYELRCSKNGKTTSQRITITPHQWYGY